ncbi:MAG: hypothetical protein AAF732_01000 [Pseudomonadota bacterium]
MSGTILGCVRTSGAYWLLAGACLVGAATAEANQRSGTEDLGPFGIFKTKPSERPRIRVPVPTLADTSPKIDWELENPFRFFTDPEDTNRHRRAYAALSSADRRAPIANTERSLAREFGRGWSEQLSGSVCWDRQRNRHLCPNNRRYLTPTSHRVAVRVRGIPDSGVVSCVWRVRSTLKSQPAMRPVRAPCDQAAIVEVPYPSGGTVMVSVGERPVAKTVIKVEDVLIVGVGDSFGSGEGNPDVPVKFDPERTANYGPAPPNLVLAGYPTRVGAWRHIASPRFMAQNADWMDRACHRSLYSHQARVALQLAIERPKRAVTFVHVACSGADIVRGLFLRYKGHEWVPNPPDLSQISAVAEAQCDGRGARDIQLPEAYHINGQVPDLEGHLVLRKCDRRKARRIDLLLVSIGGNDIGFARLVANAVLREQSLLKRLGGWFGQVFTGNEANVRLRELEARYKALKRAIHYILHIPWNESDRVVLTAYPAMALLDDGQSVCPSSQAGMDVLPMFYLSQARASDGQQAADRLNKLMKRVAERYGWSFASRHREDFLGHGICAGYQDVALSTADDLRFPRKRDGRWVPYNPADYEPYAPRQRWFRTPNDAYLTGHFHVPGALLQNVLKNRQIYWTQILLAATYSGAFHPTAEGQAVMADRVAEVARRVLEKYSGGNLEN